MRLVYDIIVVGGGHAGIESANICSKLGINVLMITNSIDNIGKISCNPSIGGVGKSQIVREIDILGGLMAKIADSSSVNYRLLNSSKGYSVQSVRVQVDKYMYVTNSIRFLSLRKHLTMLQQDVCDIIIEKSFVRGVLLGNGCKVYSKIVILTNGTFMRSKVFLGAKKLSCGRDSEPFYNDLSKKMKYLLPGYGRFKTGTPPRIDENTINYSIVSKQVCRSNVPLFSFFSKKENKVNYLPCWVTSTSINTKEIIISNIDKSPLYCGIIKNKGPRYCPSIEDKIIRYPKKLFHTIFLEKESFYSREVYVNGLSTSFNPSNQLKIIRSVRGLEGAEIIRYGYAIEYDYFNPIYLKKTLESKLISGLFLAGQINGTTGYEEAACQGLIAGINAFNLVKNKDSFILPCESSYIGILINDIIGGILEPYRMFTGKIINRSELREDNVIFRLLKWSKKNKLLTPVEVKYVQNLSLLTMCIYYSIYSYVTRVYFFSLELIINDVSFLNSFTNRLINCFKLECLFLSNHLSLVEDYIKSELISNSFNKFLINNLNNFNNYYYFKLYKIPFISGELRDQFKSNITFFNKFSFLLQTREECIIDCFLKKREYLNGYLFNKNYFIF